MRRELTMLCKVLYTRGLLDPPFGLHGYVEVYKSYRLPLASLYNPHCSRTTYFVLLLSLKHRFLLIRLVTSSGTELVKVPHQDDTNAAKEDSSRAVRKPLLKTVLFNHSNEL